MKNEIIDYFIQAVRDIFSEIGLGEIEEIEDVKEKKRFEVIMNIGMTGDIKGNILIQTDYNSAFQLVSNMFKSINIVPKEKDFGKLHRTTIGEIANQITGRAMALLAIEDIDFNITPPTIITGKAINTDLFDLNNTLNKGVVGGFGEIFLFIGIKNFKKKVENS